MASVKVFLVAGARPNFIKIGPLYRAFREGSRFSVTLIHTGQHYDARMSAVFFKDLDLPIPDISLEVGSGSHGAQTAMILDRFERVVVDGEPDLVMVVGDVNSTLACSLATAKLIYRSGRKPKIAHVEAGLRSFDRRMPEEINRVLTDALSDFLFTTEEDANRNLAREGIAEERISFVGNVMIDTLLEQAQRAAALHPWKAFDLAERRYAIVTLHRPSNVEDPAVFRGLLDTLGQVGQRLPLVFPMHPRTLARARESGLDELLRRTPGLRVTEPMGYIEFLGLMSSARLVLTDSGGIQDETTVLQVPCLTLRENTERPVTVRQGTNVLVGVDGPTICDTVDRVLADGGKRAQMPPLWDGGAARRIVDVLDACF